MWQETLHISHQASLSFGRRGLILAAMLSLIACTASNPMEEYEQVTPVTRHEAETVASEYAPEVVARGAYLAELLACGTCHTNGALTGNPSADKFAGSDVGIAWSNPMIEKYPGVLYPANITPDVETGIGSWREEELVRLIQTGVDRHARRQLPVMPWPGYAKLHEDDARAIAAFLLSLKPVRHQVPANVEPGQKATSPFVHFGVYRSRKDM